MDVGIYLVPMSELAQPYEVIVTNEVLGAQRRRKAARRSLIGTVLLILLGLSIALVAAIALTGDHHVPFLPWIMPSIFGGLAGWHWSSRWHDHRDQRAIDQWMTARPHQSL